MNSTTMTGEEFRAALARGKLSYQDMADELDHSKRTMIRWAKEGPPANVVPKILQVVDKWQAAITDAPTTIALALSLLREARDQLRPVAPNAADYVARAIKSTEGARRHAKGREH